MVDKVKSFFMITILVSVVLFAGSAFVGNNTALSGDAKYVGEILPTQHNDPDGRSRTRDSLKNVERLDTRSGSDDYLPEAAPEESQSGLVELCLDGPEPYLFDSSGNQIGNNEINCREWAEAQINGFSIGDDCLPGQTARQFMSSQVNSDGCLESFYQELSCDSDGTYQPSGSSSDVNC